MDKTSCWTGSVLIQLNHFLLFFLTNKKCSFIVERFNLYYAEDKNICLFNRKIYSFHEVW